MFSHKPYYFYFFLLCFSFSAGGFGQPKTQLDYEALQFSFPNEWKSQKQKMDETMTLVATSSAFPHTMLIFYSPIPLQGNSSLPLTVQNTSKKLSETVKILGKEPTSPSIQTTSSGMVYSYQEVVFEKNGTLFWSGFYVFQTSDIQMQSVHLLVWNNATLEKLRTDFLPFFLSGIQKKVSQTQNNSPQNPAKKLPDLNPGTRLQGLYICTGNQLGQFWVYFFDTRGYYHESAPRSLVDLDFDYRHQWKPSAVGTYHVESDKLFLQMPGKTQQIMSIKPIKEAPGFLISTYGKNYTYRYFLSDQNQTEGWKLEGYWESGSAGASTSPFQQTTYLLSKHFKLSKNGQFETGSYVGMSVDQSDLGDGVIDRSSHSQLEKKPTRGTYQIKGNRLYLTYQDKSQKWVTFYPFITNSGKISEEILYIDGYSYLKN